jgi:hypothetical protein
MTKHQLQVQRDVFKVLAVALLVALAFAWVKRSMEVSAEMVHPQPNGIWIIDRPIEVIKEAENVDTWVGKYVDQYFKDHRKSEVRMIMHCLLHRESGHGASKGHGDGGKAGGPLQFHQPTWNGYRKIMFDRGLITEIGSRYDAEQAIHTTVWAIADGRARAWGPIYRHSKGSDFATCQTPSWYK